MNRSLWTAAMAHLLVEAHERCRRPRYRLPGCPSTVDGTVMLGMVAQARKIANQKPIHGSTATEAVCWTRRLQGGHSSHLTLPSPSRRRALHSPLGAWRVLAEP